MFQLGTNTNVETAGDRLKALREALRLKQKDVADRSGEPKWTHNYVSRAESGNLQMSTPRSRAGLARGLGLTVDDFVAYIDGEISLAEAKARVRGTSARAANDAPGVAEPDIEVATGTSLESALDGASVKGRHTFGDAKAVERALGETFRFETGVDAVSAARAWLDAAAALRREGKPVTTETLLLRVTYGKGGPTAAQIERDDRINDEARAAAEELGLIMQPEEPEPDPKGKKRKG